MIPAARWLLFIFFVSWAATAADIAVLETTSGKTFTGQLGLAPEKFIITGTNGMPQEVPLRDLKHLRLAPAQSTTNALTILAHPPTHGLLGIYFNTPDCTGDFFKTRYDPTIDFDWGESAPLPDMNSNGFSVRWIGRLIVLNSEHYTFHTVTDDGVRLWINNKLIIDAWKDEFLNLAASPLVLIGGQTNEIRMEMYDARERAVARLFWSSPTTPRGIIPTLRLYPASSIDLPAVPASQTMYPAGLLLVNGSLLPGAIESADRSSIRVSGTREPVSRVQAARLIFQPIREQNEAAIQRGRAGVLLRNGDFVEGEFHGLQGGEIEIRSVILGAKKIGVGLAVAVILRDVRPAAAKYEIRTRHGGIYRTAAPRLQQDALMISDAALPRLTLAAGEIVEIKVR